ncbi:hypothetical protein Ddye_006917 [Dipteronia dyeriana]|uniref:RNase H type-1 domain-containing protein n=1 Tax=Dipteronia dyeriana TaxID=168575 RepID=A0AAE0CR58_9ROSI|nr:hypothetical protein Ddye_006917 [Dipteronia dyeriana]
MGCVVVAVGTWFMIFGVQSWQVNVVDWAHVFLGDFISNGIVKGKLPDNSTLRNAIWIPLIQEGFIIASSSQKIGVTFSLQVAEAVAICRGIKMAIDTGLTPCNIESDVEVVVGWINNKTSFCYEIGVVIVDIHNLLEQVQCGFVNFVPRKANQVAHVLVKNNLSFVKDMFWLEVSPPCVGSFVSADQHASL